MNVSANDISSGDVSVNEIVNDVSGNDVSSGDVFLGGSDLNTVTETETETQVQYMTGEHDAEILAELQQTNFLLTALLFFIVFTWVQPKIHNMVKKVVSFNE